MSVSRDAGAPARVVKHPRRRLIVPHERVPDDHGTESLAERDEVVRRPEVELPRTRLDRRPLQCVFRRDAVELPSNYGVANAVRTVDLPAVDSGADDESARERILQRCTARYGASLSAPAAGSDPETRDHCQPHGYEGAYVRSIVGASAQYPGFCGYFGPTTTPSICDCGIGRRKCFAATFGAACGLYFFTRSRKYCGARTRQVVPALELTGQLALALVHDVVEGHLRRRDVVVRLVRRARGARASTLTQRRRFGRVAEPDVRFGRDEVDLAEAKTTCTLPPFCAVEVRRAGCPGTSSATDSAAS